jgi:hypothetical protein
MKELNLNRVNFFITIGVKYLPAYFVQSLLPSKNIVGHFNGVPLSNHILLKELESSSNTNSLEHPHNRIICWGTWGKII